MARAKSKPTDSLAVATWKQLAGIKRPAPVVVARIDGAMTDLEGERWRRVQALWMAKGYPPWLSRAPLHLILCLDRSSYAERYALPDKAKSREWSTNFPAMDAGAAFMAVLLAAVALSVFWDPADIDA